MKIIWNHTFIERIRVNPEYHPVLFIEFIMDTMQNRQAVADIMFNVFKIPALYIANHAWLSLYSTNRDTGIIMNSDSGLTYAVPIVKGKVISHAILSLNLGGRDLTQCLIKLMNKSLNEVKRRSIVNDIRDKLCYVAFDFEKELSIAMSSSSSDANYELPDGTVVTLKSERFRCPEGMFKPSLIGKNMPGIHEMLYNCIMKCDVDQRQALFGNIVLTGSTTLLPGFEQRFSAEIAHLAPSSVKVKVIALPSRDYLAWIGGSKFASEPTFRKMLITKKDYEEFGPSIIN